MAKANNTNIYKYDEYPSLLDYLFGSDFEDYNKNKSFRLNSIIQLINGVNGKNNLQFMFSDGADPAIDYYDKGYFFTDTNSGDPTAFTKLILNKSSLQPVDLTFLFRRLDQLQDVVLKLENPVNPNNFFNFRITAIDDQTDYFVFDVEVFKDFYFGTFLTDTVYSIYFDIKSATDSDPLKLDKSTYTGNAQDIDDRIVVLENLQDLSTNFTGQAFAVWTGVGYVYDVIYPDYYIQGVLYPGATQQITLNASDATYPRFDVIYVNALGAQKATGIPALNPLIPTIDEGIELFVTSELVTALSTTPVDSSIEQVYNENTEWTTSSLGGLVNFNATNRPSKGIKNADIVNAPTAMFTQFTTPTTKNISDFNTLKFDLFFVENYGKTHGINVYFLNGSNTIGSYVIKTGLNNYKFGSFGSYQSLVVDFSSFTFTGVSFDTIKIVFPWANAGFSIDNVVLVKGSSVISPTQKAITTIVTDSGVANATISDDTFTLKGGNGASVSAVGKVITITPASEVVNTITNGDTTHSPSGDVVFDALALKANLLDAIPLTGTTPSNPVSGEIEVLETAKGIWSKGGSYPDDYSGIFLGEGSSGLYFRNLFDNNEVSIRTYDSGVVISDNRLTAIGLSGAQNFSPNITDLDYPQKIYVDTGLSSKLDASAYNQYFKGVYLTLAALIAAHPTGVAGDSAQVNEVGATDVINYSWDAEENIWVAGGGTGGAANTDALPEGSTNLYHTTARVLATLLTGISFATGGAIVSTDSVLAAFGKIQKQITDALTAIGLKQDTLVSGTNIKTLDGDSLLGSGNLLPKTELAYALADETANLTVSTRIKFRMPHAMTLSEVRISLNDAPTISSVIVDVKENGVSIFSTLLSIDASEKTSVTAATPAVISDINLADDAEITVSTTQIGSGDTGKGLKILFKGRKA